MATKPSLKIDTFTYTFYVDNTILIKDKKFTFLASDATSGATTIIVQSITGFAINQILCIGEIGQEKTEIIKTHATTAPSGTTITLASALTFSHPQDTKVYIINWNQFALSRATAITSQKSTLTTGAIQIDQLESLWRDTTNTIGYGFIEFKEDITNTFSALSDVVPYTGYKENTVFAIKQRALNSCKEKIDGDIITHEFLNEALWEGRREYHKSPGKRPFRRKFNVVLGEVSTGMYRISIPSDLEKPYTAENVYGVRIGTKENMGYYDKKEWDEDYEGVAHTYLDRAYTIGNKDLYCNDVSDFEDSGSIKIENDTIKYSAKGVSGGTLRISTAGSYNHIAEKDVWQNESMGLPDNFTVFVDAQGTTAIYFNCPIETAYVNQNIYCDYYRTLVEYDSDADELDEPEFDMYVPYLSFRVKQRKNKGIIALTEQDFILWQTKKVNALRNEYLGIEIKIIPEIGHLSIP